jgi:hypothetical protein
MQYVVKWHPSPRPGEIETCDGFYSSPSEAMDYACAVLVNQPIDVWVESAAGNKVCDAAKIREHCRTTGKHPQSN